MTVVSIIAFAFPWVSGAVFFGWHLTRPALPIRETDLTTKEGDDAR